MVFGSAKSQLIPEQIILPKEETQNRGFAVGKIEITSSERKSLQDYFQIADTIDANDKEFDLVEVEGVGIRFRLKILRDSVVYQSGDKQMLLVESRIPPYQFWRYDITSLNDSGLMAVSQELREKPYSNRVLQRAYQNCFSYALEGIFRSYGIDPEPFFFRRSNIAGYDHWDVILKTLFVKTETLDNVKSKTLKNSKNLNADQVLLLFRNYRGEPIHACFNLYGRTWTKNGMFPYTSYPTPDAVIDSYNSQNKIKSNYSESSIEFMKLSSVSTIEIYQLRGDIFE